MVQHRSDRNGSLMLVVVAAFAFGCAAEVESEADVEVGVQELALSQCPRELPPELAVPDGNRLAFVLNAIGQQIYACQANATGHAWVFQAPEADLLKHNGRIAGSHYAGPTWEALDGSTVVAARVAGVTVDPTAIPWLLLSAASHTGEGRMSRVSFIHRLDTVGGLAPTTGCDAEHVGEIRGVDYEAAYYFYVPSRWAAHGRRCN